MTESIIVNFCIGLFGLIGISMIIAIFLVMVYTVFKYKK